MKSLTPFTPKQIQYSLSIPQSFWALFLVSTILLLGILQPVHAQINFTSKKVAEKENPHQYIHDMFVNGSNVYLATAVGLFISTDGGNTFAHSTKEKNGLLNNEVKTIFVVANTIYAGTQSGISVSKDGGRTFKNTDVSSGISKVIRHGKTIYVLGKNDGLYISTNEGNSFVQKEISPISNAPNYLSMYMDNENINIEVNEINGDGSDTEVVYTSKDNGSTFQKTSPHKKEKSRIIDKIVNNGIIYNRTKSGLAISTDGGKTYTTKKTTDGLVDNNINCFLVNGKTLYVGTPKGLSVSTDEGKTFTNYTKENSGLSGNEIIRVFVSGSTVYLVMRVNGIAIGTPAPKPTLPKPSDTYQLQFKHSNKVVQLDTGESMETGIAEGFGASIGVDGVPTEEIGGEMGEDPAAGDFVMDAALLQKTTDKSNKNQHWTFKDAGNGFHKILSSTNSEVLELKGEGSDLFPSTGKSSSKASQLWKLEDAGNGYYRLLNKANNKYLEVPENDQTEDAMLHYGPKSGDNQLVKLVKVQ